MLLALKPRDFSFSFHETKYNNSSFTIFVYVLLMETQKYMV